MDHDPTAFTDIHSHLVPDVDDGARTIDESVEAVEKLVAEGVRKIITTPHLDGSLTLSLNALEERLSRVTEAFEGAAEAVGRAFPEVEFRRGHEVMLDVPDVDFSDPRLRLDGTAFVLLEWPRLHLPPGTTGVLKRMRREGYIPVVAHPERYIGIDMALAAQWKEAGAYLQVNYASLDGRYGSDARAIAFRLLRRGWADYLASDFHGRPDRRLYMSTARRAIEGLDARETFVTLSLTNPARILRGEEPLPVPLLPPESGFWAKVKGVLNSERT